MTPTSADRCNTCFAFINGLHVPDTVITDFWALKSLLKGRCGDLHYVDNEAVCIFLHQLPAHRKQYSINDGHPHIRVMCVILIDLTNIRDLRKSSDRSPTAFEFSLLLTTGLRSIEIGRAHV